MNGAGRDSDSVETYTPQQVLIADGIRTYAGNLELSMVQVLLIRFLAPVPSFAAALHVEQLFVKEHLGT